MCKVSYSCDVGRYRKVVGVPEFKPAHKWCYAVWAVKLECGHDKICAARSKTSPPKKGLCYLCGYDRTPSVFPCHGGDTFHVRMKGTL